MNLAQMLGVSVQPLYDGKPKLENHRVKDVDKFRIVMNTPKTTGELSAILGYSRGGMHCIIHHLRKRNLVKKVGIVKDKTTRHSVWKWIGQ